MNHQERIVILDFGGQTTQLIARRLREHSVYCEIHPFNVSPEKILTPETKGIIFSGGPASVTAQGSPHPHENVYNSGLPILGICYGLQLIGQHFENKIIPGNQREFGRAEIQLTEKTSLWSNLGSQLDVWMNHGDHIEEVLQPLTCVALSEDRVVAGIAHQNLPIFGVQFHPEVTHTPKGSQLLKNFAFDICGCKGNWNMKAFIDEAAAQIRNKVGEGKVLCALSGGLDSAVVAALLAKAIHNQLICIHVDTGLQRKGEREQIEKTFSEYEHLNLKVIDATKEFFEGLSGESEPEKKRKIIGRIFIEVFQKEAKEYPDLEYLAQGTIYPDVIESVSVKGPSATIKSHHNVGGLPETLHLKLIEPLRELFKDEVREVGRLLGLPDEILNRHPFPGPGLAVRVLGEVTPESCSILREADAIFTQELIRFDWYNKTRQAFVVLLPVKSVGVMGDERTYERVCALRAVNTDDFMTADFTRLPYDLLARVASRIANEVRGINRVTYDVTTKPPATVEWE